MQVEFPMLATFTLTRTALTYELASRHGVLVREQRLSFVLRADSGTQIRLSSGEALEHIDIDFSMYSRWKKPEDLNGNLTPADVGYLFYHGAETQGGKPKIHGAALWLWPIDFVPEAFLSNMENRAVHFMFGSTPTILADQEPFIWLPGKPHIIRISEISFSLVSNLKDRS